MITTSSKLDWIEWTFKDQYRQDSHWVQDALRYWNETRPRNGYTRALEDPVTGMTVMWHDLDTERDRMGWHFTATGSVLEKVRQHLSDMTLLRSIKFDSFTDFVRISRMDIATDVYDSKMRPAHIKRLIEAEILQPRLKSPYYHESVVQGHTAQTFELGSRKSSKTRIVFYEKSKEMKDFDADVFRIEQRHRRSKAPNVLNAILASQDLHETAKGVLKDALKPVDGALDFILDAPEVHISQEVKDADFDTRWDWCNRVAMPALKRLEALRAGTVVELLRAHGLLPHDCT